MNFEQEYQLQEFKEIQDQYFDKTGACYTGNTIGTNIMERMLKLIDVLSERSKNTETLDKHEPKQLILPIVSNQRELLIAYEKTRSKTVLLGDTESEIVDEVISNL